MKTQLRFPFHDDLIVDNFAGGGGASTGIEMALGRSPDIAINHDPEAVAMHTANHPHTRHYCEDVFVVDPSEVTMGKRVALAWFSPDCKHFSKAKGGKPKSKKIRGLAWVVIKWVKKLGPERQPRVIILENVEEFEGWGPLLEDGTPCPDRKGKTFDLWKSRLRSFGYTVESRQLTACDFGAPTSRTRLFIVARCDGQPIVWPEPTHGTGLLPYRTAAECIDWSNPCPSIFERKKPLADNTLRRIAKGLQRYVFETAEPFIVPIAHYNGSVTVHSAKEPLRTITASPKGGAFAVAVPHLQRQFGRSIGSGVFDPVATITAGGGGKTALVSAFLAKHYTGVVGHGVERPIGAITTADHHSLVTSHMIKLRGTCRHGQDHRQPMPTVTAGGLHLGEVRAFLIKYYGQGVGQPANDPLHTITSKDRMGLVTIHGEEYQLADIGMRMLQPRELYRAQGFPNSYIIDITRPDGKPLTKTAQVRMVGNSVSPYPAAALVSANCTELAKAVAA